MLNRSRAGLRIGLKGLPGLVKPHTHNAPASILIPQRFLTNSNNKLNLATASTGSPLTEVPNPHSPTHTKPSNYLDTLNTSELLGYGVIGLATLTKPILDLVIKLFPYTPIWLIKLFVYKNYCGGDNIAEVLKTGSRLSERGINNMMISLTIEACDGNALTVPIDEIVRLSVLSITDCLVPHTVKRIDNAIANGESINDVPPGYIAIKPTGMIENAAEILLNYNKPEFKAQYDALLLNCSKVAEMVQIQNAKLSEKYPERVSPFINCVVDAERNDLQQGVYKLQRDLFAKYNKADQLVSVVGTVQMYLKESSDILRLENKLAQEGNYKLGWKLVRGAYIHSEPNRGVIHNTKQDTDINYDNGISMMIDEMVTKGDNSTVGHLVVASHNGPSQFKVTEKLSSLNNDPESVRVKSNVVLGQLLGMADNITFDLMNQYHVKNIIKYVPWGPPFETKQYLLRRLEENGDAVRADSGWNLLKGILLTFKKRLLN